MGIRTPIERQCRSALEIVHCRTCGYGPNVSNGSCAAGPRLGGNRTFPRREAHHSAKKAAACLEFHLKSHPDPRRTRSRGPARQISVDRSKLDLKLFGQLLHRSGAWRDRWTKPVACRVVDFRWRAYNYLVALGLRTIRLRTWHFRRPVNFALVPLRTHVR